MKIIKLPEISTLAVIFGFLVAEPSIGRAETQPHTFVVRERATASFIDGTFTFKVLKIKGYTIDLMIANTKRMLKIGESISPENVDCSVTFVEIAIETRIARFRTNCW